MNYNLFNADYIAACKGDFPLVYVALHPFCWLDPSQPHPEPLFYPEEGTGEFSRYIKRHAQRVSWKNVADLAEFESIRDVYHAMCSWRLGLREEFCVPQKVATLELVVKQNDLWTPNEDTLCPMLEINLGQLFEALNKETVFLHHDWGESTKKIASSEFLDPEIFVQQHHELFASHVYPADMSVLTASLVDKAHTVICLKGQLADKSDISDLFEGFWATPSTNAAWWQDDQWAEICADPRNSNLV